jgi:hypothetical protein
VASAALVAWAFADESAAEDGWDGVARVVAVGDVHGDHAQLVTVLEQAGIIDVQGRWAGGRTRLVQTGDRVDRGPASRKVMDLLMRLEEEAKAAGGRVHALVGNHEAMNVLGDLRYVSPEEFAEFATPDSGRLRDEAWERLRRRGGAGASTAADRQAFDAAHPLGWVEHRRAWAPKGRYGAWVARQDAVARVGDTLFLHGGISPKYADLSLRDLNGRIRRELAEADPLTALLSRDADGPLWFRGLAGGDAALSAHVDAVLRRHGIRRIVIGHTRNDGVILPLYGGRVVSIDVGLSRVYGGPPASLLLEQGRAYAVHRGRRLLLPEGGDALVAYVREVMALDPDPGRLRGLLARLEAAALSAAPR